MSDGSFHALPCRAYDILVHQRPSAISKDPMDNGDDGGGDGGGGDGKAGNRSIASPPSMDPLFFSPDTTPKNNEARDNFDVTVRVLSLREVLVAIGSVGNDLNENQTREEKQNATVLN